MNEYVREYAKVERRARRRGSFLLVYAPWVVLLAGAAVFGRIWTQTQAVALVGELAALQAQARELATAQAEHQRTVVGLSTRGRLARIAREDLGMSYPDQREVVFLPVPGAGATEPAVEARRLAPEPGGLAARLQERLRGLVSRDAYALGTR